MLYLCIREDKPRNGGFIPVLIRSARCDDEDPHATVLVLWVDQSRPRLQNFHQSLQEAWKDEQRRHKVQEVIDQVSELPDLDSRGIKPGYDIESKEYVAICQHFGEALIRFLEEERSRLDDFLTQYRQLYRKFRCELKIEKDEEFQLVDKTVFRFQTAEKAEPLVLPTPAGSERLVEAYFEKISEFHAISPLYKEDKECLEHVASKLLDFMRGVEPFSDEGRHLRDFCKALLLFAESNQGSLLLSRMQAAPDLILGILEFIILAEENPEERQAYFDKLVNTERDYSKQRAIFSSLVKNLKRGRVGWKAISQVGMLIAEYYLRVYDLGLAASTLEEIRAVMKPSGGGIGSSLKRSNPSSSPNNPASNISFLLLTLAISLYKNTGRWFIGFLIFLLVFLVPAGFISPRVLETSLLARGWASLDCLVLIFIYIGAVVTLFLTWRQTRKDQLPYFQLFFPRLFGAIVVGFTPLIFDDMPWRLCTNSDWLTLLMIAALVYLLSIAFLLLDAYKMQRSIRGTQLSDVVHAANQLFLIGLMQSLIIAIIISSLLSPFVPLNGSRGIVVDLGAFLRTPARIGHVGLYPTLIFLWAGIALFIGSFAQLLWQQGRVTEPL